MFPIETNFETQFTFETESSPIVENRPFQILLLGNWSGSASEVDLSARKPLEIDRDNFEDVLRRLKISVQIDMYDDPENLLTLNFSELDDFHPDNLFAACSVFEDLRDIRRRLLNKHTFEDAAHELRSRLNEFGNTALPVEFGASVPEVSPDSDSKGLLDQILFQSDNLPSASQSRSYSDEIQNLVGHAVEPFLIRTDENEQAKLLETIDTLISQLMTKILSSPQFVNLESAWRGLYFLVRNIETDAHLKIFIYDVTKSELSHNLQSVKDLSDSDLHRLLFSNADYDLGFSPWSLLAGNYTFDTNVDDTALLIRLAKLSATAKAPFISYIRPESLGIALSLDYNYSEKNISSEDYVKKLWATIRSLPESEYIGLATPRYLSRLPYGAETDPVDAFSFEEFGSITEIYKYVWSNPCFICVVLIAQSFQKYGWCLDDSYINELNGFPVHIYLSGDETKTQNAIEFMPSAAKIQSLLDFGLIPLFSPVNSDKISVFRFHSISSPSKPLKGKWND